jgi:hypothetical protein
MTPSEAARLRWERERQRKAEQQDAEHAEDTRPLDIDGSTFRDKLGIALASLPQADIDAMVRRMARQAREGEERSAHVLARLADQAFGRMGQPPEPEQGEETWESMPRERRAAVAAELIRQVEEMEAAAAEHAAAEIPNDDSGRSENASRL